MQCEYVNQKHLKKRKNVAHGLESGEEIGLHVDEVGESRPLSAGSVIDLHEGDPLIPAVQGPSGLLEHTRP